MWHFKTRIGTFWIISAIENDNTCYRFGIDDELLGQYNCIEDIIIDISNQSTGCYEWDSSPKIPKVHQIDTWQKGEPFGWSEY